MNFNIDQGSPIEVVLAYVYSVLLFVFFFGALLLPIVWTYQTTKERWRDYEPKKKIQVVALTLFTSALFGLLLWRSALPSNF